MAEGKFYWLKLKRDFFKRHDIRIIESMPNGKDYILFYLKLLLESIDHDGKLRFSETIPYNEQMLSVITNTNVDVVKSAMDVFIGLNMVEIQDDKTIYMQEVEKLVGSETKWAEKKRLQRAKEDIVPTLSTTCPIEKEIEIKKDIDIEKEGEGEEKGAGKPDAALPTSRLEKFGGYKGQGTLMLTEEQIDDLLDKLSLEEFDLYCEKLSSYIIEHPDKTFKSHYRTILKWVAEDRKKV